MALKWLHKFVTAKIDGPDTTLVKPSDWNDEHAATSDIDDFVLGRPFGAGPGDIVEIPTADLSSSIWFTGVVLPFAGTVLPSGWLWCNGALLNRVTYAKLFGVIGINYDGGDGSTTFGLPDMRGMVAAGLTTMGGTPNRGNLGGGSTLGNYLGGERTSDMDGPNHSIIVEGSAPVQPTLVASVDHIHGNVKVVQPTTVLNFIIKD